MKKIFLILLLLAWMPGLALASPGDAERGKEIYDKRCWWCHGEEGAGDGPASDFLEPPPRDFTEATFKFKSTPFDEFMSSDEDLFKMIEGERTMNSIVGWSGMNDSSMPGWADMLGDQQIWDLVEYIKVLGELEPPEQEPISYDSQVASSENSIARGKELFLDGDRCSECHGKEGRGDGTKKLKDDWGFRTWPRNFTKGWSFRVSNDPKDIFTSISTGIPGTQMPSFADPDSEKSLAEEDRWHIANYVASLNEPYKKPGDNTVIKALRVDGEVPDAADDRVWDETEYKSFYMIPQIIAKERFFTPSINSISVKAVYNDKDIALLLEWDDRTKSLPGDRKSLEIAGGEPFKDAVSVQLPVEIPEGSEKPNFAMGDATSPVNIWFWKGESTTEPQSMKLFNATGFENSDERDATGAGLKATGVYSHGTWRVVMKRPLKTEMVDKDIQLKEGKYIPIAFAAWDGSNFEKGSKHVMTTWYWLLLEPETGAGVYAWPLFIALVVFGGELLWLRSARKK
jgi:DMSO reductase family type II enzyme heme b subunit